MKKIQVKLNSDMLTHKAGAIISIEVDDADIPVGQSNEARYWRKRFKEAEQNKCLEFVIPKEEKKKKDKKDV
jgi:hypothetical protein